MTLRRPLSARMRRENEQYAHDYERMRLEAARPHTLAELFTALRHGLAHARLDATGAGTDALTDAIIARYQPAQLIGRDGKVWT